MAFIHHTCMCVCASVREKKEKMLEVADYSRLIEEFLRNGRCGRGSKHLGTLRET